MADRPGASGPSRAARGLGEVAGADALEVEPGNQLLDAFGLSQVGRQDGRVECLPLPGRPAVADTGLLHFERADAGVEDSLGQGAVTDDLLPAGLIAYIPASCEVAFDLGLDGLGEQPLGSRPQQVGERVLVGGKWHGGFGRGSLVHGGVLQCLVGIRVKLHSTQGTPPFSSRPATTFGYISGE